MKTVMRISTPSSERGAILIQTAVAALLMVGFGAFVVDYGVLWIARHQAQNAADAGAMAGAIARAYEDFDDPPDVGGIAAQNVAQVASANPVWRTAVLPALDATCPPEVGVDGRCVRADVYRDVAHGNALPTWFAPVFGITSQSVRATATARVVVSHATNCLRPWAIPDRWDEESNPADPSFQKYDAAGAELPLPDVYNPPTPIGPGTGLRFPLSNSAPVDEDDLGSSLAPLRFDDLTDPLNKIFRNSLVPLDPPGGYDARLAACHPELPPIKVGDPIPISCAVGCSTARTPNAAEFTALMDDDPGAGWHEATRTIQNSCAPACAPIGRNLGLSPRLVPVAVFDVDAFQRSQATGNWAGCPGGKPCVLVVNIVGLFIEDGLPAVRVTSYPGLIPLPAEAPKLTAASSFLKAITLVR